MPFRYARFAHVGRCIIDGYMVAISFLYPDGIITPLKTGSKPDYQSKISPVISTDSDLAQLALVVI